MAKVKVKKLDNLSKENDIYLDYFKKIKNYAENQTGLFLAAASAIITIVAIFVRFCFYIYDIGFYEHFKVAKENISLKDDSNILMSFLYLFSIACILISANVLGYINICKRTFLKYLSILTLILYVPILVISLIISIRNNVEYGLQNVLRFLIICFVITCMSNFFAIGLLCSLSDKVKIQRTEILITKLQKREQKNKKRIDKAKERIEELKTKENEVIRKRFSFAEKVMLIIVIFCAEIALITSLIWISGNSTANQTTNMSIIVSPINKEIVLPKSKDNPQNEEITDFALIYKCNDYIIVAPCYVQNDILSVYTSYQMKIESSELLITNKKYNEIKILDQTILNVKENE